MKKQVLFPILWALSLLLAFYAGRLVPSASNLSPAEAEKLCGEMLGTVAPETGFPLSYNHVGSATFGEETYYVMRITWLVNNSHQSYIGDCFVSDDGSAIYDGYATPTSYELGELRWTRAE